MRSHSLVAGLALPFALALTLSACGGGGGGGGNSNGSNGSNGIDTTAPSVVTVTPTANATGVALNATLSVTFSKAMDCATLTASNFTLKDAGNNAVSGTIACSGSSATFTPAANLSGNIAHSATLTRAVKDSAGNALAADYGWSFTTGAALDTTAPTVSAVSPANSAVGVAPGSDITASFSEAMKCTTLTGASFTLAQGGSAIDGSVTCSGNSALFAPAFGLPENATVNATLTSAAQDSAGNGLAADYHWSFTTRARAWSAPGNVMQGAASIMLPAVRLDGLGNAFAVWQEEYIRVRVSRYTPETGWTTTNVSGDVDYLDAPRLAVSPSGSAVAVWQLANPVTSTREVWASTYTVDQGWSSPASIDLADGMDVDYADVAMDAEGNAIAVWTRFLFGTYSILARNYKAGLGWSDPVTLTTLGGPMGNRPTIAFVGSEAFALWTEADQLWYSHFTPGSNWSAATVVDTGNKPPMYVTLAAAPNGRMVVVWQNNDGFNALGANHYDPASGSWGTAVTLTPVHANYNFDLAMDASGNALVAWRQPDATPMDRIWSSHYNASNNTWSFPVTLDDGTLSVDSPHLAMDPQGNAVALWEYTAAGVPGVGAARYVAGAWGTFQPLETGGNEASLSAIAQDHRGDAVAIWQTVNVDGVNIDMRWSRLK